MSEPTSSATEQQCNREKPSREAGETREHLQMLILDALMETAAVTGYYYDSIKTPVLIDAIVSRMFSGETLDDAINHLDACGSPQ